MKKRNRLLAFFIAVALIFTSVSWDFSGTLIANADEGSGAETRKAPYKEVIFADVTVDKLTQFTSTSLSSSGVSSTGKTASEHEWTITDGILKSKYNGGFYALYFEDSYENFKVTTQIDRGGNKGIVLGEKDIYPSNQNSSAIRVYYDQNVIYVRGAIDKTTVTGGTQHSDGIVKFSYDATDVFTLNVEMENGVVSVWVDEDENNTLMTVEVNSKYPTGNVAVGLWNRNNSTDEVGGFKSFAIEDLDASVVNFGNIATSNLTQFSSTKFVLNAVVTSEQNKAVSEHWGISTTDSVLRSPIENAFYAMYYQDAYENFQVTTDIYPGANHKGVVFGEKNVFPNVGNKAIRVYYEDGTIYVRGAVDATTVTGGTKHADGIVKFTYATTKTFTLNVKVLDGVITVWIEGQSTVLTVRPSSDYPSGEVSIGLWSRRNGTAENGGFKYFAIEELQSQAPDPGIDIEGSVTFADVKVNQLTQLTSTSYKNASGWKADEKDKTMVQHGWTIADGVLKSKAANTFYSLCYEDTYENFEVTTKIVKGNHKGIYIGEKYVYPSNATSSAIRIYYENTNGVDYIIARGAVDCTDGIAKMSLENLPNEFTLHVKMSDGILTVFVEGIDKLMTVEVTSNYPSGNVHVGLWSRNNGTTEGGGFKSFEVEEVQAVDKIVDGYVDFDSINVSDLEEVGYTSTQFNKNDETGLRETVEGQVEQSVSSHWFSTTKSGELTSTNTGLKTRGTASRYKYHLNTPYTYEDFKVSTEVYWGNEAGVVFGTKNAYPNNVDSESVAVYVNANQIQLNGALDFHTVSYEGTNVTWNVSGDTGLFVFDSNFKATAGGVYTLNVQLEDDVLTVWVDGYDGVLKVRVSDTYKSGIIALRSNGDASKSGGLKSFVVEELSVTKPDASEGFETMEQVENMFDAYYLKDAKESSKLEKVDLKEHWRLSTDGLLSRKTSAAEYSVTDDVEILTYTKQKYTDFELTYTYQQTWLRLGILIGGDLGTYPLEYSEGKLVAQNGAVVYLEAQGYSNVQGHLSKTNNSNLLYRILRTAPEGFRDDAGKPDANIKLKKQHTVKVVVKDKVMSVFIDGNTEPTLHVALGDNYKGGYISLFSHAPIGYGIGNLAITDKVTTAVPAGGTTSSDNTFTANFDTAKFDTSQFKTYYLENAEYNPEGAMAEQKFEEQWTIDEYKDTITGERTGVLESNSDIKQGTDMTQISVLTYNKKMTDFVATYDYVKTDQRLIFMFGTEMGKYPIAANTTFQRMNGGVAIYPENDLGINGGIIALGELATHTSTMRPSAKQTVKVDGYHIAGEWSSNVGTWHKMTIAVIDSHCYVYLDDYGMIADYELVDYEGGYISLAAAGRTGGFDNLTITDLSGMALDSVISAENPKDITVKVGTDESSIILPSSVKVILKNETISEIPVKWVNMNYNPDKAGVYRFTAVVGDCHVGVTQYIKVVEEIPSASKAVKAWSFDTPQDLDDFAQAYLKDAESGYITEGTPNWYVSTSGQLKRDGYRTIAGTQYKEIGILTYKGEKYVNFELEVEYSQAWQRMMVLFGSDKAGVGSYIDLKDIYAETNSVAGFVEMEGTRNFIGNLINANFDSNDKEKINNARESGQRVENYYDKTRGAGNVGVMHKMKVRVVGDQATMWVDDVKEAFTITLTNYDGGYISLVSTVKGGAFDNLKITRLNAQGKPEVTDPSIVANGTMNVQIDETASTELVIPERQETEGYSDTIAEDREGIPAVAYIVGGTTVLLSMVIGALFILLAKKKHLKS